MTQTTPQLVDSIISIFLIIKLMTIGHPKGKQYMDEVCSVVYPNAKIQVFTNSSKAEYLLIDFALDNRNVNFNYSTLCNASKTNKAWSNFLHLLLQTPERI